MNSIATSSCRALAYVVALALAGCASDPYVRWSRNSQADTGQISLTEGIAYARHAQDAYSVALSARARTDAAVEASLITLGAVALGLGAANANRDAFVGAGLLGGTVYTLSNTFRNRPQELAYLSGVKAIDCAIDALRPYAFPEAAREQLSSELKALHDDLPQAGAIAKRFDAQIALLPSGAEKDIGTRLLATATQTIDDAEKVLPQGQRLLRDIDGAGFELEATVDAIGHKVDVAVHDNLPELSALPAIIKQLPTTAALFVPGLQLGINPKSLTLPSKWSPQSGGIEIPGSNNPRHQLVGLTFGEWGEFLLQVEKLRVSAAFVAGALADVEGKRPMERLKECGVDTIAALSVDPSSIDMAPPAADQQISARARNGKAPYSATVRQEGGNGLTVNAPFVGDASFIINVAKGTAGKFHIVVSDSAAHEVVLEINVAAKVTGSGSNGNGNGGNSVTAVQSPPVSTAPPVASAADSLAPQLKKLATQALGGGVKTNGVQVDFHIKMDGLRLVLGSDNYTAVGCAGQDALRKAVLEAPLVDKDNPTTLQAAWTVAGGGNLSASNMLEFTGLCAGPNQ